jgi:aminotransferase
MKLSTSDRSKKIVQSEIRNMSIECDKVNGINLSQGFCDLELPLSVKNGAKQAIDDGINQYTRYDGLPELRKTIASKLARHNNIDVDPEKNIIVSCGATGAFYSACLALLNQDDEIIVFEPYYGYHVNTLLAVGVKPVYIKMNPPDWSFDMDEIEKLVTEKTKGIMINTPANPSGKVFLTEELDKIANFCIRHDLFVFTDEIYEYFVYDNLKHTSPMSIEKIKDRTILISGYSKTFSVTGWRIGYCVCDEKWATMIGYVSDLVYVCGPAPLQVGVSKGISELPDEFYKLICAEHKLKRDKICSVLKEIGLIPFIPQGAYYVLADASSLQGADSKEKAMYLLQKTGVASVPGSAFYHDNGGDNLLRFCFAKKEKELDLACEKLLTLNKKI